MLVNPSLIEALAFLLDGRHKGRIRPEPPARAPKTETDKGSPDTKASPVEPAPPTDFIPLMQIAIAVDEDDKYYGVFALDVKGRVWRLDNGVWRFGGAPQASDLPPGW
jgi:hypothetical protein